MPQKTNQDLNVEAGVTKAANAQMVYVTPSHQYPLGVSMSLKRRLELLDWAQKADAWILEDDYDSEFRYDEAPIPALRSLDKHDRVIYIGSFSKVLFPAPFGPTIAVKVPMFISKSISQSTGFLSKATVKSLIDRAILFMVNGG